MTLFDLFSLSGKRVLVTGGTSGIGLAIALSFQAAGAQVTVASNRQEDCDAARARGLEALCMNLGDRVASEALAEAVGPVEIVVANAGIEGPVGATGACEEEAYLRTFDINLHAAYWLVAALSQTMGKGGRIILMSSLSALRGNGKIGAYAMTKAALAQLARNLAVELGPRGITANAIAPGLIETPFSKALMANADFMERRLAATPLRRVGQPEESAAAALFLAGPGGGFTTGQLLVVDGGTAISDGS
jgi:NAD(P)-dependent dehydrogenase (short-subunit alcohol dehydrogenase family)